MTNEYNMITSQTLFKSFWKEITNAEVCESLVYVHFSSSGICRQMLHSLQHIYSAYTTPYEICIIYTTFGKLPELGWCFTILV